MSVMCLVWCEELYADFLTWSSSSHSSEINTIILLVRTLQCRFGYMLFQPMNFKLLLPFCLSDSVSLSLFKSNNSIGDTQTLMVRGPHSTFDGSWTTTQIWCSSWPASNSAGVSQDTTSPQPCQASAPSLLCLLHTWLQKAAVSSSSVSWPINYLLDERYSLLCSADSPRKQWKWLFNFTAIGRIID